MVTRGQLLERPVIIPTGGLCLDGIYLRGEPGTIPLLLASPLGTTMVSAASTQLAYAAARVGRASLRLDYRGVGASEGERSLDPAAAAVDLAAGAEFLWETVGLEGPRRRVVLAAMASGAWPALRFAREHPCDALLLLNPPRALEPGPGYAEVGAPVTVVVGDEDPAVSIDREQELAREAPNARLEVIYEAGPTLREALPRLARLLYRSLGVAPPE